MNERRDPDNSHTAIAPPPSTAIPLIGLIGNPNTGKTSVFNLLTGARRRVANYPGVTVDRVSGRSRLGTRVFEILDLPGTYSLAARSPDERIAVDALTASLPGEPPVEAAVVVVDADNLERNLFLVSQVLELGVPTVIALTMTDLATRHGRPIDAKALSDELGCAVVGVNARAGVGREELLTAIAASLGKSAPLPAIDWPLPVLEAADVIAAAMGETDGLSRHSHVGPALRCLLDVDTNAGASESRQYDAAIDVARKQREILEIEGLALDDLESNVRYAWCTRVAEACAVPDQMLRERRSEQFDNLLTHRVLGSIVFVIVMGMVFLSVFAWAAPLMDAIDGAFGWLADGIRARLGDGVLASFLADGVIGGVGGVLVFLPQILVLIALITIMEDCGYLARAAFLMDRVMRWLGLGGRSFVPLLSSFACAIPGIMAARSVGNSRDRLLTILVAPLMPCSARIPVYTLLVLAFVPAITVLGFLPLQGLVFAAVMAFGVVVAAVVAIVLKRTLLRGEESPLLLELPGYKLPSIKTVALRVYDRARSFLVTAGTIILAMSMIIWALGYFPRPADLEQRVRTAQAEAGVTDTDTIDRVIQGEYLRQSYLARMGKTFEPIFKPLGWDWRISTAVLAAFPAREVVVSTMGIIYNLGEDEAEDSATLKEKLRTSTWPDGTRVFTLPVALSLMVFFALCCQCQATVAVIKRETNSWRWAGFAFGYMTALAYVGALIVYQIGSRLG